jgi:hypothetical protein
VCVCVCGFTSLVSLCLKHSVFQDGEFDEEDDEDEDEDPRSVPVASRASRSRSACESSFESTLTCISHVIFMRVLLIVCVIKNIWKFALESLAVIKTMPYTHGSSRFSLNPLFRLA